MVQIYFRKFQVEVHNVNVVSSLVGDLILLESTDIGNAKYLGQSISSVIPLKPGCNVMLLYNISSKLRNGESSSNWKILSRARTNVKLYK
jgi:hypothetical protein